MRTATAIVLSLSIAAPLGGCAGDRNKQVKQAEAETAEQVREQREEAAERTKEQTVEGIERQQKAATENLPSGAGIEQRAKAQSQMMEERQKFAAESQARLQKAQARIEEARQKSNLSGGRVPTATRDKVESAAGQTSALTTEISRLSQVSNDQWESEKRRIESRLDELEKDVDDASSKVDNVKP